MNETDKPNQPPQMDRCDVHADKLKDIEHTLYGNNGGLKVRVYQLESQVDNLTTQNKSDHTDIKKALSKNTWALIGFCLTIIALLIGALLKK